MIIVVKSHDAGKPPWLDYGLFDPGIGREGCRPYAVCVLSVPPESVGAHPLLAARILERAKHEVRADFKDAKPDGK